MRRMMMVMVMVMVMVMACGGEFEPVARGTSSVRPEERLVPELVEAAWSSEPSGVSAASGERARDLAAVDLFALGGIGFAGATSRGEELTRALLREPDAIEAFTWLGERSAPAPRLYAYWALRTLAPDRAAALAKRLRQAGGTVERMSGCIGYTRTVAETLAEFERLGAAEAMPRP